MKIKDFEISFDGLQTFSGSKIIDVDGLASFKSDLETVKNASGNGEIVVGRTALPRDIKLIVQVPKSISDETLRYFQYEKNLVLYIDKRKINCIVEKADLDYKFGFYVDPILTLNLYCPDPYFYDISDFGQNIAGIQPVFGFPWKATLANGITMGYFMFSDSTIFENKGDRKVGLKVIFKADRGDATNIQFTNLKTGQFIKLNNIRLNKGDILEISTIQGSKHILKNGINVYGNIDRLSDFFSLDIGDNLLQYDAETGKTNLDVYLYYTPVYSNGLVIE